MAATTPDLRKSSTNLSRFPCYRTLVFFTLSYSLAELLVPSSFQLHLGHRCSRCTTTRTCRYFRPHRSPIPRFHRRSLIPVERDKKRSHTTREQQTVCCLFSSNCVRVEHLPSRVVIGGLDAGAARSNPLPRGRRGSSCHREGGRGGLNTSVGRTSR